MSEAGNREAGPPNAAGEAHAVAWEAVASGMASDPCSGLTQDEAERRLRDLGPNVVTRAEGAGRLKIAVRQFHDPLVLLLVGAAAVSSAIGERVDGVVISAIVLLNAALGFVQEAGAERAILALRDAVQPTASVVRDDRDRVIAGREVVPGDVINLTEGDRVPADARLVQVDGLAINESLLTGEPVPVEKSPGAVAAGAPLAERTSMVYAGTAVTRGQARAVVTSTGSATEIGRIGDLARTARRPPTPLQRRLGRLSRFMVLGGLAITGILAAAMLGRGAHVHEAFLVGVSVAVAAVPEGLAATITIALADGARRMARRRAIVRHLSAVETIGAATVIAADKTGTLTINELRVAAVHAMAGRSREDVLRVGALATTGRILEGDGEVADIVGDPVDVAFLQAAGPPDAGGRGWSAGRLLVVPFDPERKRLTAAYHAVGGVHVVVKGAPEVLAARSRQSRAEISGLLEANRGYAARGHRVLAIGEARLSELPGDPERLDAHLDLVGLVALHDPLRSDAAESVRRAQRAGVRVLMLTGDQPDTAAAVAGLLGLPPGDPITGPLLAESSDEEVRRASQEHAVFARATPADKLRLVTALQSSGEIVIVTGDGVNDTPALRRADVGVAMGANGTEAAREAADIVLTDDAFSTIVAAIEEGRRIAHNMRAFVMFLLSANAGEVLLFTTSIILGGGAPMSVVQVLTVNLLTDGLPAVALARDPPSPHIMARPPRRGAGLLEGEALKRLAVIAGTVAAAAGAAYAIGSAGTTSQAQTMAFATLALAELLAVFSMRSTTVLAWHGPPNRGLAAAVMGSLALLVATVYLPVANHILGTVTLSPWDTACVAGLALLPLLVSELWKLASARRSRR